MIMACNLLLGVFWDSAEQEPYWVIRVIHYNHFFLLGTQKPGLVAWAPLPLLLCGGSLQPGWGDRFLSGVGRWAHAWSWVTLARESSRRLQGTDARMYESCVHASAMYVYLLHTPVVHGLKWLLWRHLPPYLTIALCSTFAVGFGVLAYHCSQACQKAVARRYQASSDSFAVEGFSSSDSSVHSVESG